jgi:hypothetical protein
VSLSQRLVRVEGALCPDPDLLDGLRALMRYCLVFRHLNTVVPLGCKAREQMTAEEWREFRRGSVKFFDSHEGQRMFGDERTMRDYVRLDGEELRQAVAELHALPDAADYFY